MQSAVKRPLAVTIIGVVYILAGVSGLIYHATEWKAQPFHYEIIGISFVRVLGIAAGIYTLRGANWARWLALAWMAFHVAISYLNGWDKVAMHAVFLALIGFFLLRRQSAEFFQPGETPAT